MKHFDHIWWRFGIRWHPLGQCKHPWPAPSDRWIVTMSIARYTVWRRILPHLWFRVYSRKHHGNYWRAVPDRYCVR